MLARLLGANWKTSVTGIGTAIFAGLTFLSGLSYDVGPIALVIPAKYKSTVTWIAGAATAILWCWNSIAQKSKEVTGGSIQQTLGGNPAAPGTQTLVDVTKQSTPLSETK